MPGLSREGIVRITVHPLARSPKKKPKKNRIEISQQQQLHFLLSNGLPTLPQRITPRFLRGQALHRQGKGGEAGRSVRVRCRRLQVEVSCHCVSRCLRTKQGNASPALRRACCRRTLRYHA